MKNLLLLLLLTFWSIQACTPNSQLYERKARIEKMESKKSKTGEERKSRSESTLIKFGVPINKTLPNIEDESTALVRTKEEVSNRALVLLVVALKGEGLDRDTVLSIVKKYELEKYLSPKESSFIKNINPSQSEKIQFSWRYEAAWTLLWALGYVSELSPPTKICDVPAAVRFMKERTKEQFITEAKLRSISEILNEADLIYRYHWAVVDSRVTGLVIPSNINSGVVLERHYTLNWLMGYMEEEWDNISTDT